MPAVDNDAAIYGQVDDFIGWLVWQNVGIEALLGYPREIAQFLRWQDHQQRVGSDGGGCTYLATLPYSTLDRRTEIAADSISHYCQFTAHTNVPTPARPRDDP